MKHQLAKGAGQGRSKPLNPEFLINMYAEQAPDFAKSKYWLHSTPGTIPFVDLGTGYIRGMYNLQSDDSLFVVHGTSLYKITSAGVATNKGEIAGSGRVGMADNGIQVCITIGAKGYIYNNNTDVLTEILDSDWPRANHVTFLDGFFVFDDTTNAGQFFISALLDGLTYDGLDFATAERYSDNLVRPYAHFSDLILFGTHSTEIWYNSGNADFAFEPVSGGELDTGLGAHWSVQSVDNSVIWLDQDGIVRRKGAGSFDAVRISTHAIEYQISQGSWRTQGTDEGANSYTYVEEGHEFYVLTVPDTITVIFDAATGEWHQRKSQIQTKKYNTLKTQFYAFAHAVHYVGSAYDGKIYKSSIGYASESGDEIISVIQCPQIYNENGRFIVNKIELDLEWGVGLGAGEAFKQYNQNQGGDVCNINGTWSVQASAANSTWNGLTYGDKFVAVASETTNNVQTSSNGTAWSAGQGAASAQISEVVAKGTPVQEVITGNYFGTRWGDDGTKLFAMTSDTGGILVSFTAATPYDHNTLTPLATYDTASTNRLIQGDISFNADGTKIIIAYRDICSFTLSTAWDITSASKTGTKTEETLGGIGPFYGCYWDEAAGRLYLNEGTIGSVTLHQYLITDGDADSITYESVSFDMEPDVGTNATTWGLTLSPDKFALYAGAMISTNIAKLVKWDLPSAGVISSATNYEEKSLGLSGLTNPNGMALANDLRTITFVSAGDWIHQYEFPFMGGFNDVDWSGSQYLAVGDEGGMYSADGDTWYNSRGLSVNNVWEAVEYVEAISRWIAVASSGTDALVASSSDGMTWVEQTSVYIVGFNSVAASTTKIIFVGDNGVVGSDDMLGVSWDAGTADMLPETEAENNTWEDVEYSTDKSLFVAMASTGSNRAMWSTGNGSWFISDMSAAANQSNDWTSITYGAGYFVGVSDTGTRRIVRSASGKDAWELVVSPVSNSWNEIAWAEDLCLMASVSGSGAGDRVMISESVDGTGQAGEIDSEAQTWIDAVVDPMVMLDISGNTKTFDMTQPWRSMGKKGEFEERIIWRRLGQHRSFTPRFAISAPVRKALFGVYVDVEPCDG